MTRPHVAAAILVALGIAASGCGRNADAGEIAVLRVVTGNSDDSHGEYHFEVPTNVPAGATRLELVNDGAEPHHAQLFEFADGATISDLTRALGTGDPAAALEFGSFLGGTALVSPGTRSQADAVIELEPRRYALICLVPDPDGTPHLAHGMLRPFDVVEHDDPASPPDADLDVRLIDYAFEMPETIDGDATLAITNASRDEPHEMVFLRADDDTAPADVAAAVHAGTPLPGIGVGGMQAIPPGTTQHLQLDLPSGRYIVICVVPSADGRPHIDAGMIAETTVT